MIIKDLTNFMHTFFFQSNFQIRLQKLVIQLVEAIDSVTVLVNNESKRARFFRPIFCRIEKCVNNNNNKELNHANEMRFEQSCNSHYLYSV